MVCVLGVLWVPHQPHETGATLVKDGQIIAAVNEDRLTGIKHDSSLPINSIKEVLRLGKINPAEIDAVTIPFENPAWYSMRTMNVKNILRIPHALIENRTFRAYLKGFGIDCPVYYINHHLSHAASAYYTSGWNEATIITMDGTGDGIASAVYTGKDGELREVARTPEKDSPGFFYAKATAAIGFKANDGEGKTMGLACYGNPDILYSEFAGLIDVRGLKFVGNFGGTSYSHKIDFTDGKLFARYKYDTTFQNDNPFLKYAGKYKNEDIAAAAQKVLEEVAVKITKNAVNFTKLPNVCLAGGVALNVKLNQRIRELGEVEDIFVHPNPGDAGVQTGSALYWCHKLMRERGSFKQWRMEHVYYGPDYSDEEIEKEIDNFGLNFERLASAPKTAAELVDSGRVVGWFQGKLEYGPRALGNRSVVADPRIAGMKDRINKYLKKRDWFMPFAPSMMADKKENYLVNAADAPFMILGFDATEKAEKEIPAVVHVDKTLRPQTVKREYNQEYYDLIHEFEKRTGVSTVLNTSFNKHGLPMIMRPKDAIDHLVWGCVEELIIGNYRVFRKFR
ncbi:MAG: hypothetical protein HY438_04240 [DPANN group archaeon]|nr:hypothetical protein [DPANN group archaeon]